MQDGLVNKRCLKAAAVVLVTVSGLATGFSTVAAASGQAVGAATAVPAATSGPTTAMSTTSATDLLARNGIATVASEASTAPLVPVSGPVGIRFTQAQVAAMARGASDHSGIAGSTFDASVPVSKGEPPFSYLLAAWVSTGTSSGAQAVRAVMGSQDWSDAPSLVYPAIALPLFSAAATTALGVPPAAPGPAADRALGPAAAGASASAAGARPARAAMGLFDAPCSLVTNFIQQVLDTVFENLKLGAPSGSSVVAKVGSFFVNLWNVAVSLAQTVVTGLLKAVGEKVVGPIVAIAGAAATLAEIVSYILPWTATVTALPPAVALGGNSGMFKAVVSSGANVTYPGAVQDCAQALHITLPSLSAKGSKASWTVGGPITPTTTTAPTLDAQGSNTLGYDTGLVPCANGATPAPGEAYATITVTRSAVTTLKTLVSTWVSSLLGAAGALVKPFLQPLLDNILSKVDKLTQVSATGAVTLTKPTGGDKAQTSCPCVIGTWRVLNEEVTLAHESGGAGATWTLVPSRTDPADGTTTVDHDGSEPLVNNTIGISVQYSGTEVEDFAIPPAEVGAASGTWVVKAVSGAVIAKTTFGNQTKTEQLPFDPGATFEGNWSCQGDAMSTTYGGVGETITLTRISH